MFENKVNDDCIANVCRFFVFMLSVYLFFIILLHFLHLRPRKVKNFWILIISFIELGQFLIFYLLFKVVSDSELLYYEVPQNLDY